MGFHLGMTLAEVKAHEPLVQFGRADPFGVVRTTINPHFDPRFSKPIYAGVRTISFDFLDGKLVRLWIGFDEGFKWSTLDEFVPNFSKLLGVPADWPRKGQGRELMCDGFSLFATLIASVPSLRITDEPAEDVIGARREAAAAAAEGADIIGDTRTKTYYGANCAAREHVPAENRAVFANKEEAEKAGYKSAPDCK
jgi:hypothetical protein